jgi:argininosuccinate lyase
MAQDAPKGSIIKSEPALSVGVVTAFLTEFFGLLVAFGVDLSTEQQSAIIATVTAAATLIVVMSGIIRQLVWSPESVEKLTDQAYKKGDAGEVPPVNPL